MMSRHKLSTTLKQARRYKTEYGPTTDTRKISSTLPKTMAGVVIHCRFFVHPNTTSRMCLECTILDKKGDAHSTFQNFLFTAKCISVYVPSSKTNVVICELEDACTEGYESFGFPLCQTQPNTPYLSQSDQMGYGLVPTAVQIGTQPNFQHLSQLDQMGYGLVPDANQMRYGLLYKPL
jgi:hypothetical protein